MDFGKFRYEQAKKEKESKKHQHASIVKEVQLSPRIDPHDLGIKVIHAVDFLCEDMKVKIALKFRGREMAHTEVGFQVINKFLAEHRALRPSRFQPKLIGRGINVMISPLPRNKRAKNPRAAGPVTTHPRRRTITLPLPNRQSKPGANEPQQRLYERPVRKARSAE